MYAKKLAQAKNVSEVFELVKDVVRQVEGKRRSGLMLGLGDLGVSEQGFIGAFYPVDSNLIVVNRQVLDAVKSRKPAFYNTYLFHVLLHEYVHSLGMYDEAACRRKVFDICKNAFGKTHATTRLAHDPSKMVPLLYADPQKMPQEPLTVELVKRFDEEAVRHYS